MSNYVWDEIELQAFAKTDAGKEIEPLAAVPEASDLVLKVTEKVSYNVIMRASDFFERNEIDANKEFAGITDPDVIISKIQEAARRELDYQYPEGPDLDELR